MQKNNEKKVLIFSVIAIILLIVVVVGATYAFFTAQGGGSANTNVNVQTNTTDNLSFSVREAISITANQDNFGQDMGNQSGSTTASATLTANNATNSATRNYYLYLDITNNEFTYTVDSDTPELILTITNPEGDPVESISGLKYVTVGEADNQVSGFDITTASDIITLASNYEITSTGTVTQTWNITVTFVNLDSDQVGNAGKSFEAEVIIQEEKMDIPVNLASYITDTLYTADGENGLYYHDGQGDYINADQEAEDNSYRFSGGDYQVTEKAIIEGLTRVYTADAAESNGIVNFYCNGNKLFVGHYCENEQPYYYTLAYDENTHYTTLQDVLGQAVRDGYLTSDNIKNFVCFGPGASENSCDIDNLYRIIGVFDNQVKLIKYDYAKPVILGEDGDYYDQFISWFNSGMRENADIVYRYHWNYINGETSTNDWSSSRLNTVNLNTNYWNYLGGEWQSKIANTTWQVGGNTWNNIAAQTVKSAYTNELLNPASATTYQDEIGLIYVSDYMYSSDASKWTTLGGNSVTTDYRSIKGDNWMYMGWTEWAISKRTDNNTDSFAISGGGDVCAVNVFDFYGLRPAFYLNSSVEIYEGHAGTASDPYRIVL